MSRFRKRLLFVVNCAQVYVLLSGVPDSPTARWTVASGLAAEGMNLSTLIKSTSLQEAIGILCSEKLCIVWYIFRAGIVE